MTTDPVAALKDPDARAILDGICLPTAVEGRRPLVDRSTIVREAGSRYHLVRNRLIPLITAGIVREQPDCPRTGRPGAPIKPLTLAPDKGLFAGLHIGRRHTNAVLLDYALQLVDGWPDQSDTPPDRHDLVEHVRAQLARFARVRKYGPLLTAGLAFPGAVTADADGRPLAFDLPWGFSGPLRFTEIRDPALTNSLGSATITLTSDVGAGTLAEALIGGPDRTRRPQGAVAFIRLGSGVAAGFLVNGNLLYGSAGYNTFGHTVIDPTADAPTCSCNKTGCLQTVLSYSALERDWKKSCGEPHRTGPEIVDAAVGTRPDPRAVALFTREGGYGWWLGLAVANLINTLSPGLIVLGGPIARAFKLFESRMLETIGARCPQLAGLNTPVEASALDGMAVAFGAALFARDRLSATS